ncbi:MAG TPA: AMP-binding protein, partial [Burkholderiales bacterium]
MFTRHFAHWPPGQPRTLELPRETVYRNLERSAARDPERAAIDYYGRRLSYRELKRQVDALAGWLQQRCGVSRGERVLLYMQNCPQFVIAYYAILRADAVVVPVNPMNRTEELRHYVQDSDARVAIVGQDVVEQIRPLDLELLLEVDYGDYLPEATDLPIPDVVRARSSSDSWSEAIGACLEPGPHTAGPEDLSVMPYTSGTTGKPKGCMHTHASLQA